MRQFRPAHVTAKDCDYAAALGRGTQTLLNIPDVMLLKQTPLGSERNAGRLSFNPASALVQLCDLGSTLSLSELWCPSLGDGTVLPRLVQVPSTQAAVLPSPSLTPAVSALPRPRPLRHLSGQVNS